MPTDFTPVTSLIGGILIGLSAVVLMAGNGRIAGMTGILSGLLPPFARDLDWRVAFLAGAVLAPVLLHAGGLAIPFAVPVSVPLLAVGGLIVGAGVAYGNGCPSGHGVCGLARLSPRSLAATLVFMLTAFVTVYVIRHLVGA